MVEDDMLSSNAAWIDSARQGDGAALGQALEPFREYLTLVASRAIGPKLATKVGASDMVQETFLAAQRGVSGFRGSSQAEWRAWLEAILVNQLANLRRSYLATQKRRLESALPPAELSRLLPGGVLGEEFTSPSRRLQRKERDVAIEEALRRLPESYRQVILLHHDEGLTFEVIAGRLGISADAARKLWGRALASLKQALGPNYDPR